jgi:enolase-phosphatase E1
LVLRARVALIDIEGTVGSIAFVRDVLFPYADERMDAFVVAHITEAPVREALDRAALEADAAPNDVPAILQALHRWAADDVKSTALKQLQGMIWVEGFEEAGMRGHLYDDAVAALRRFHAAGVRLFVYSSGSVAAQKLLFGHSTAGNLLDLFSGFYDTMFGGKHESQSYRRIADDIGVSPSDIVFFSDNLAELDAARAAGVQTIQLARPSDGTIAGTDHPAVPDFNDAIVEYSRG